MSAPAGVPGELEGPAAAAAAVIEAINTKDPARLRALLGDSARVETGRSVHAGPEAIITWARKEYDHLERRYAIDELREAGDLVLALGAVQYVWSDGGEVADSSPVALELELVGPRLRRLCVHDDVATALAAFEA